MKERTSCSNRRSSALKVLTLGGTPYNRGLLHGNAMKDQIHAVLRPWKEAFVRHLGTDAETFIRHFLSRTDYVPAIKRWTPDILDEVKGIADGADVDFETMLVFQFADEYIAKGKAIAQERCSSLGFGARGDQPACVAQNMDIESYADGFQLVLHIRHEDSDLESFVLTLAGCIALNGMNNKAIGICCNALSQLNSCRDGLPVSCIVRGVLQQRTVEDAVAFVHRVKHATGQNYIIGGRGAVYSFECSAGKISRFRPNDGGDAVWHTNHPLVNDDYVPDYQTLLQDTVDMQQKETSTRTRVASLERWMSGDLGNPRIDRVKQALSSSDSPDYPVCRPKGRHHTFTFASTIMVLFNKPEFHVAPGPPNVTPYESFRFIARTSR